MRGLVLTWFLVALAAAQFPGDSFAESIVEVPVLIPLTGSGADEGLYAKTGFELAAEKIGGTVKLRFEDTKGDPKTAVSVYRALTMDRRYPLILTWGSGVGLALTPLVNKDAVVQFSIACSSPDYSSPGDFTFRTFPSADIESKAMVDIIVDRLGAKNISIAAIENDYGQGLLKRVSEAFTAKGGRIVRQETFEPNGSDYRSTLMRLKSAESQLIYLASYPKEGAVIIRQLRELGIRTPVITGSAVAGGKSFIDVAGDAAEGVMLVRQSPPESPYLNEVRSEFRRRTGEETENDMYLRAYDALTLVFPILAGCGDDSVCVRDALFTVSSYTGVMGKIGFDKSGDVLASFGLYEFKGGRLVLKH